MTTTLHPVFPAAPAFFRACCRQAAGGMGYRGAGYELARHVGSLCPDECDEDQWQAELDALCDLLWPPVDDSRPRLRTSWARDDDAVLDWFVTRFPACLRLVPARRRQQFLAGVIQAAEDEVIGLEM